MLKYLLRAVLVTGFILSAFVAVAAEPAMEPFVIGKARVTALQDLPGEMPLSIFRGADESVMQALVPSGKAPAGVTAFLVQSGGGNLVVDTGYGLNIPERKSALPNLLHACGVGPEAVDTILLTHMHGDHIGGLVRDGKPFFPNAVILVGKTEYDFWTSPKTLEEKPALERNVRMVAAMRDVYGDKVKTFAFGDKVMPEITALAAVGHTPGHTMFLLDSDGQKMLFWGDIVHAAALQFPHPDICATYDMDMPEAVKTRREVFEKAVTEKLPVAGAHLPFPAVGTVSKVDGGGYTFQLRMQ